MELCLAADVRAALEAHEEIAAEANIPRKRCYLAVRQLEEAGLIQVTRCGTSALILTVLARAPDTFP